MQSPEKLRRLVALSLLLDALPSQQTQATLTDDQRAVFALADPFDDLDTSRLPFFAVFYGTGKSERVEYGFLERRDGRRFYLRQPDLGRLTVEDREATVELCAIRCEPSSLQDAVALAIHQQQQRLQHPEDGSLSWMDGLHPDYRILLLARTCARARLFKEVAALWEVLPEDMKTLAGATEAMGTALEQRVTLDFTDSRFRWSDLLDRHDRWLALFPQHARRHSMIARQGAITDLLATVRQRNQRPRPGLVPTAEDLVFDLHDEFQLHSDRGNDQPACSTDPTDPPGPMGRLWELDLDAVPPLLAALGDRSPTRCVAMTDRSDWGARERNLGEQAEAALEEITGIPWQKGARGAWEDWYARARKEGVRKMLTEGVVALDATAIRGFLRRWPDELDAVIATVRSHDADQLGSWVPRSLLRCAGPGATRKVNELCADLLYRSTSWQKRYDYASFLLHHGDAAGLAAVLDMWQCVADGKELDVLAIDLRADLSELMIWSGDPVAWRRLARDCNQSATRVALAEYFVDVSWRSMRGHAKEPDRPEIESCFRACLAQLLADDSPVSIDMDFLAGGRSIALHEATCADVAACVLGANWPAEFVFDPARTTSARRRQIETLRGRPVTPARPARVATGESAVSANTVSRVAIEPSAASLDAGAQARIRAVEGKQVTERDLAAWLIATADAARPATVFFRFERTGEGEGTSLSVSVQPFDENRMAHATTRVDDSPGPGWRAELRITVGGVRLISEDQDAETGRLVKVEAFVDHDRWFAAIRKALASDPKTGVEITMGLQTR